MDRFSKIRNIDLLTRWLGSRKVIPNREYFLSLIRQERNGLAVMDARELGASEHGLYSEEYGSENGDECLRTCEHECENSLFPCLILDPRPGMKIIAVNAAAAVELLKTREELVGRPVHEITPENAASLGRLSPWHT